MDEEQAGEAAVTEAEDDAANPSKDHDEVARVRSEFRTRLIAAGLRTEAVRAGMIDLDGLKLVDASAIELADDDSIVNGRHLMQTLRKNKPWLFHGSSSSSVSAAPSAQPVRQKTAMDMTDEEYASARTALLRG